MDKQIKYIVFKTKWGWFGLAATENRLFRTCLPHHNRKTVKSWLLKGLDTPTYDKSLFAPLQKQIIAYFKGRTVNFRKDVPLALDYLSPFTKQVLTACRTIPLGQTATYSALAKKLGRPRATRAVGSALAKNPVPLIIPCHRIIRSDGQIGKFSAPAGPRLKAMLLDLEGASHRHRTS